MAKSKLLSRIGAVAMAAALACTSLISASAATIDKATIDMDAKAQLSIYKYDFTNAKKDGVWNEGSYVSTGQYDARVNEHVPVRTVHLPPSVMDRQATAMQLKVSSILTSKLRTSRSSRSLKKTAVVQTATSRCCMQSIK